MTVVWIVLGAVLIGLVAVVCYGFFVIRPRMRSQVEHASEGLARELHGRQPLLSAAASCSPVDGFDKDGLAGVGALAMTDEAVVFVNGTSQVSLVIARSSITEASPASKAQNRAARGVPSLVVRWQPRENDPSTAAVAFAVGQDVNEWVMRLSTRQSPL